MYILIIGCGKLGSYLAGLLSKEGKDVVIIDKAEEAFKSLNEDFSGFTLAGDATEIEVLERAKINKADVVVTTTEDDNINVMIAQIAKKSYSVPCVLARLFEPARENIYREFGIETICPTILSAAYFKEKILGNEGSSIPLHRARGTQ